MRRALLSILLSGCAAAAWALQPAPQPKPRYGSWGFDYATMDKAVKPGDDFYAYVNGSWLRTVHIPADKSRAGYNYDLPDEAERDVRAIAEDATRNPSTPTARQIADFYAAWMDEAAIEKRGLSPLKPYLARIAAAKSAGDIAVIMAQPAYAAPLGIWIQPDVEDPTRYTVGASQGSLGLPTRDYYLLKGAKYDAIRKAYHDYIAAILTLAGIADPPGKADIFLALETRIATDQWAPERMRDPVATHNPMSRAQLDKLAPQLAWTPMLASIGLGSMPTIDVATPSALTALGHRLADVPLATWQDYLTFRFISERASFLPKAFDDAHFAFYGKTLNDIPEQAARWKRGVRLLDEDLGEAVGQVYVRTHWPAESERQASELVEDLRAAYGEKIRNAAWMDDATRVQALAKLATFDPRLGHPVKYIDYSSMIVRRDDPLANAVASDDFDWRLMLSRMPKPVDRTLWGMTPQTVNAYYDPPMNQVTFPAAQLQPPFFDPAADPAVNYGETGATIGHEMGHGFDDEGRQFDAHGKLRDWWTPLSAQRYTAHAQRLVQQFDGYEPLPGVHIKGQLTLGENLADLGGLEVAFAAYRHYVARHGEPKVIDGFTGDQRFFLAYAQSWQAKIRDGSLREQLLGNPHSPDAYRVNGIVRNVDAWYTAFGVQSGDKLYLAPADRVHVW